jgi:hypothetical protein
MRFVDVVMEKECEGDAGEDLEERTQRQSSAVFS